jgi:carbon storage regulator
MLVLSRKVGEAIQIGEGIRITVIRNDGNKVRLGIECDRDIRVMREELLHEVEDKERE